MFSKTFFVSAILALASNAASAGVIQVGGMAAGADGKISSKLGVCTVTFNGGSAANTCGAVYSNTLSSNFRTGNLANQYATPAGDTTGFLTVGPADGTPINIALATAANYFGFYAGSLDSYNLVQFFMDGVMVDSFNGTQINAVAFPSSATDGNQAQAQYIDYFPAALYNRIIYSSSANAFETDSHAFGLVSLNVPEPSSIALLGLGAAALLVRRRRS